MALGYAGYQGTWPEQTPLATKRLTRALLQFGINLVLPSYDLTSKDQAARLLESYGIANTSLEQKCLRQVTNVSLGCTELEKELGEWESAITASFKRLDDIELEVWTQTTLGGL